MRATLTTIAVVGLVAASAGSAAAWTGTSTARNDAALHAQAMRYQAEAAYYRDHGHVAPTSAPAPVPIVRVTRAAPGDGGFDWADAGIGAGSLLAMSLLALATTLFMTHRRRAAHATPAAGAR
jgi:type II secretory pathway pseudopilin PulG